MIPDCRKRLTAALEDLEFYLVSSYYRSSRHPTLYEPLTLFSLYRRLVFYSKVSNRI